jgi:hypothetical protein
LQDVGRLDERRLGAVLRTRAPVANFKLDAQLADNTADGDRSPHRARLIALAIGCRGSSSGGEPGITDTSGDRNVACAVGPTVEGADVSEFQPSVNRLEAAAFAAVASALLGRSVVGLDPPRRWRRGQTRSHKMKKIIAATGAAILLAGGAMAQTGGPGSTGGAPIAGSTTGTSTGSPGATGTTSTSGNTAAPGSRKSKKKDATPGSGTTSVGKHTTGTMGNGTMGPGSSNSNGTSAGSGSNGSTGTAGQTNAPAGNGQAR